MVLFVLSENRQIFRTPKLPSLSTLVLLNPVHFHLYSIWHYLNVTENHLSIILKMWMLFACFNSTHAGLDKVCTSENDRNPRGFCGDNLSSLISTICRGIYNTGPLVKKRIADETAALRVNSHPDVFIPKSSALSYLNQPRSKKRSGIVCECCLHMCSMSELSQYCAGVNKRRAPLAPDVTRRSDGVHSTASHPVAGVRATTSPGRSLLNTEASIISKLAESEYDRRGPASSINHKTGYNEHSANQKSSSADKNTNRLSRKHSKIERNFIGFGSSRRSKNRHSKHLKNSRTTWTRFLMK